MTLFTKTKFYHIPLNVQEMYNISLEQKVNDFLALIESSNDKVVEVAYLNKEEAYIVYQIKV